MKHLIILILFLSGFPISSPATEVEKSFQSKLKNAYEQQNYSEAIAIMDSVSQEQGVSPELYLDLGNSYFLNNDYGKCVVAYMRGLKLSPRNSALRSNLEYVLSKVDDKNTAGLKGKPGSVLPDNPSFFQSIGNMISRNIHPDVWAWSGVISFILCIVAATIYLLVRNVMIRKVGFFSCFLLLAGSVLFNIFAFSAASSYHAQDICVLISYEGELHVEPSQKSPQTGITLSAGTPLDIIQQEKTDEGEIWYKVKLNSDNIGWIEKSQVEVI